MFRQSGRSLDSRRSPKVVYSRRRVELCVLLVWYVVVVVVEERSLQFFADWGFEYVKIRDLLYSTYSYDSFIVIIPCVRNCSAFAHTTTSGFVLISATVLVAGR